MGKSSKDKRDAYYRLAKEQSWRARSAFKLIQLDEEFDLFAGCTRVVDLCAAPGSWSQVLSRVLVKGEKFGRKAWVEKREREDRIIRSVNEGGDDQGERKGESEAPDDHKNIGKTSEENTADYPLREAQDTPHTEPSLPKTPVKIVAIDLQPMSPLEGITMLQGDITDPATIPRILHALDPPSSDSPSTTDDTQQQPPSQQPVDLILSDGAPDVTGLHDLDIHIQTALITSALDLALRILRPGKGKFVAKIFRGRESASQLLFTQLRCFFGTVTIAKPRASRASSLEAFVVCENFLGVPAGFVLGELGSGKARGIEGIVLERSSSSRDPREGGGHDSSDGTAAAAATTAAGTEDGETTRPPLDNDWIPSFVACGDLSSWDDADATTHLPKGYVSLDPVQPPTAPPYKRALELRRQQGGSYGRTSKPQPKKTAATAEGG